MKVMKVKSVVVAMLAVCLSLTLFIQVGADSSVSVPFADLCPETGAWPAGCIRPGTPCPPTGAWPAGCIPGGRQPAPSEPAPSPAGVPCPADGSWPKGCVPGPVPCPPTGAWPMGCVPNNSIPTPQPIPTPWPDPIPGLPPTTEPTPEPTAPPPPEPVGMDGLCYQEVNGVVMAEAEAQMPNGWTLETNPAGYSGRGYYRWSDIRDGLLNEPGTGTLTYLFKVDNPGRYYMRLHNFHNNPSDSTWSNDAWVRMNGAAWFKAVSWSLQHGQWGWATAREANVDGKHVVDDPPFFDLDAGIHTLDISARSGYFGIDRIVMFQEAGYESLLTPQFYGGSDLLDNMPTSGLCDGYIPPVVP